MAGAIRFVFGAAGGALLAYVASQLFLLVTEESAADSARSLVLSRQQREEEVSQRFGPKILSLTVMGGLLGGVTAAFLGAAAPAPPRRRRHAHGPATPLDRAEFQRVLAVCAWVDFRDKTPDYMQGLIVGRLAESDSALARRIDALATDDMEQLVLALARKKNN